MISEWFVTLAAQFSAWVAGLFPEWDEATADAFDAFSGLLSGLWSAFVGMGAWVDWVVIGVCVGVQMTVWLTVVGIKLIRAVLAHVPLFGGSGD